MDSIILRRLLLSGLIACVFTLLGCGQKGPLILPDQPPEQAPNNPSEQSSPSAY